MKKKLNLIIFVALTLVMLFANISFGTDTLNNSNALSDLLSLATFVNAEAVFTSGATTAVYDVPVLVITNKMIETVENNEKYKGLKIEIEGDKIHINDGVVKKSYVLALGDEISTAKVAGVEAYPEAYEFYEGSTYEFKQGAIEAAYGDESATELYSVSFAGAILNNLYDENEILNADFSGPSGATLHVMDADGNKLITTTYYTNPTIGKAIASSEPFASGGSTVSSTNEGEQIIKFEGKSSASDEPELKSFSVDKSGIYVFSLTTVEGVEISNIEIYDKDGNMICITSEYGTAGAALKAGETYYIKIDGKESYELSTKLVVVDEHGTMQFTQFEVEEAIMQYDESSTEVELYQKVLTWFVLKIGEGVYGLISKMAGGYDISIDALIFDQYPNTALSLFKNDADHYQNNPLLVGAVDSINYIFGVFTKIALIIYMIVLVYLGIRIMLMSTNAGKKAKSKELLLNWVKGIAIIYLFPYVIRYTILLNHGFVTYIYDNLDVTTGMEASIHSTPGGLTSATEPEVPTTGNYMNNMYNKAKHYSHLAYALCWFVMLIQLVQFLIVYFNRLIRVIFLIAIFPLVSISYAIDKIGDGKSQAFNHWCKEFILQVFIQSFHAINYVLVMGIVFGLQYENWFLIVIGITYVAKGGDILRGLFAQMQGGAGDKGGSLSVVKAFVKTKVAISAVKSLSAVASKTFGSQSLIGKGVTRIENAYDANLQRRAVNVELQAINVMKAKSARFNPDGTLKKTKLSNDEIKRHVNTIFDNKLMAGEPESTDERFIKAVKELSSLSDVELKKALRDVLPSMSEEDIAKLEGVLGHAAALSVISDRKNHKNVDIQTTVDAVIKDRKEKGKTGNEYLDRYIDSTSGSISDLKLRKISAAHSITIDPKAYSERSHEPEPTDSEEKVRYAMAAVGNASFGEYTIKELHHHLETINAAKSDARLRRIIINESKYMNYSINDFELNLAVQTINHSNDSYVLDEDEQKMLDAAIRMVQTASSDKKNNIILSGLHAKIEDLKVGEVPHLIDNKNDERSKIQKQVEARIAENPYMFDRGEEYEEYLRRKEKELSKQAKKDLFSGVGMMAVGGPVTAFKVGLDSATAGIMTGASIDGKDTSINEVLTVVPTAVSLADDTASKAGKILTTPIRMVDNAMNKDSVSLNVNMKSIIQNKKHYEDQAKEREIDNEVIRLRNERESLLDRINKKASGTTKRKP